MPTRHFRHLAIDEVSPRTREFVEQRRDVDEEPGPIALDFEEYTRLYRESWSDPVIRWLLSTVSSAMIFDDHDVHDNWNISAAWLERMRATDWWEEHIVGAIMSYWIYQHAGNLSPEEPRPRRHAAAGDRLARRPLPPGGRPLDEVAFRRGSGVQSAVYQAVCSPLRNPLDRHERYAMRFAASRAAHAIGRAIARAAGVRDPSVRWRTLDDSPWFDNQVASLKIDGRSNVMRLDKAVPGPTEREPGLERVLSRPLA